MSTYLSCILYRLLCLPSIRVSSTMRVAILIRKIRQHGVQNSRINGCGCLAEVVSHTSVCIAVHIPACRGILGASSRPRNPLWSMPRA